MFAKNRLDPDAIEVGNFHFGGKALGGEVIDGIRKRLPKIAQMIEQDYELRACVVSEKYYTLFRDQPALFPMTEEDATKCLPLGVGVRPMGIRLCPKADDLIYRVAVKHGLARGINTVGQKPVQARRSKRRGDIPKNNR